MEDDAAPSFNACRIYALKPHFHFSTHPFDSVVRHPVQVAIDAAQASATVWLPRLEPKINLFIPWRQPFYRLVVHLTRGSDVVFAGDKYEFASSKDV